MTREEFDSKYLIGNEKIDKEHFELFLALDELIDAIKTDEKNTDRIDDLLYKSVKLAKAHFGSEIGEMIKHNYPYIDTHIDAHTILEDNLQDIVDNFGDPGPMLKHAIILHDKLLDHMVQYDILYANYARVMNATPGW